MHKQIEQLQLLINHVKEKMSRLVEYILLLLSVVLVVSTLTGSTNNYYNGKILTTILMDNIPFSIINNKNLLKSQIVVSSVIHYWFTLLIFKLLPRNLLNSLMHH